MRGGRTCDSGGLWEVCVAGFLSWSLMEAEDAMELIPEPREPIVLVEM